MPIRPNPKLKGDCTSGQVDNMHFGRWILLLITFCNPNPIPTLKAPAIIVIFVKSIPIAPRAMKNPTSRIT
jgi:hypothetical protein